MKNELGITRGAWIATDFTVTDENGFSIAEVDTIRIDTEWDTKGLPHWSAEGGSIEISEEEAEANAKLIAEAGTVANETGLTPRQLKEQRDELLAALTKMCEWHEKQATYDKGDNGYYKAKRTINNCENTLK